MSSQEKLYSKLFGAYGKVYTLSDKNGDVFYVGCTVKALEMRVTAHISEARKKHKYANVEKSERIEAQNFQIIATIVEMKWVTGPSAAAALKKMSATEKMWIKKYHDLGYQLCNKEIKASKKRKEPINEYVGMSLSTRVDASTNAYSIKKEIFIQRNETGLSEKEILEECENEINSVLG